ncbi:hypothetical protein [Pseudoalteromonas sp. C1]|uniref:hypothetical protein n=2 Tax=Pseudoalteromonas TaxID=53246 RepID=UPI0004632074|nr:hypothetical protein [Pseudoalteromonas sp. C1]
MKFFMLGAMIMAANIVCAATYTFESWPENGKHCEFSFDSAPTINWDGTSELPISFLNVQSIFNDWIKVNLKPTEEAHPTSFDLATVAADGLDTSYWVFKVRFVVFKNGQPSAMFNRRVAIDMAGKVIEAQCGNELGGALPIRI